MKYTIQSFDPDNANNIVHKQAEIGEAILGPWRGASQTNADRLMSRYTADDFDPETRLYAYLDDEIVGFITGNIVEQKERKEPIMARIEIPIVPDEHAEARDLLLDKMIEVLQDRDVDFIRTRAGPGWGYTLDYVNKYNFEKAEQMSRYTEFNPVDLTHDRITKVDDVIQYKDEKHREMLGNAFREHHNIDDDTIINDALDQLVDGRLIVHYHGLLIEESKIIGRLLAYSSPDDTGPVILGSPLILIEEEERKNEIATKLIGDSIHALTEQEQFDVRQTLFTNALDLQPLFEQFGLEYKEDLAYYDKRINEV